VLHDLTDVVAASDWSYLLIAVLVMSDAIVPAVPGETVVIAAAILASSGDLEVALVVAAACAGSFAGDNVSFGLGRTLGEVAAERVSRGERGRRLVRWARRQLSVRGGVVIVAARFIPGGRTATTFAAGSVGMPWRRFAAADAIAAAAWALYTTGLGYLGGSTFRHNGWAAAGASLAAAAAVALAAELVGRRAA
jgi:membrane protein DedA with SNARE-associated domain